MVDEHKKQTENGETLNTISRLCGYIRLHFLKQLIHPQVYI